MNSVLLGPPAVTSDYGGTDIVGMYPVYASERDFVRRSGFAALWNLTWDRIDPGRRPAV
jgi:hypothetical protein